MNMPERKPAMAPEWLLRLEAPKKQRQRKPKPPSPPAELMPEPSVMAEGTDQAPPPPPEGSGPAEPPPPPPEPAESSAGEEWVVHEPGRHNYLLTLATSLRFHGATKETITAALEVENERRCSPPLDEQELAVLAHDVPNRYAPDALAGVTIKFTPIKQEPATETHAANGEAMSDVPGCALTALNTVEPQPLEWLVAGYLPLGKLVLLAGDGGHGKSALTLHLAARLSRGKSPFGLPVAARPACEALLINCEDDVADTVVPRLMAVSADMTKVHWLDGVRHADGGLTPFSLSHFRELEAELGRHPGIRLVVIDPAGAFIGNTGIDDHKDSDLRALLGPLAEVAARKAVTILLIKHLSKGAHPKAVARVGGSTGYINTVRAAFLVAPDRDDEATKYFVPLKFNLAPKPSALAYQLVPLTPDEQRPVLDLCTKLKSEDRQRLGEQLFRVEWRGPADVNPDQLLAPPERSELARNKVEDAGDWIVEFLRTGEQPSAAVVAAGKEKGFGRGVLFKARRGLGKLVEAHKDGFAGGWLWRLAEESAPPPAVNTSNSSNPSDSSSASTPPRPPEESQESEAFQEFRPGQERTLRPFDPDRPSQE
jgi:hypothetical protein